LVSAEGENLKFDAPITISSVPETLNATIEASRKATRREIESAMKFEGGILELIASGSIY